MALPKECERHPGAFINHTWEEDPIARDVPVGKLHAKNTDRYECSICGRPLAEPVFYF